MRFVRLRPPPTLLAFPGSLHPPPRIYIPPVEPARTQGQRAGSKRNDCPGGRSCPNLRRANVLDDWITQVATERNGYREALERIEKMSDYDAGDGAPQQEARLALRRGKAHPDTNGHTEVNGENEAKEGW